MKLIISLFLVFFMVGCASSQQPLSWSEDLKSIKEEPINKDIELINNELLSKNNME